MADPTNLSDQQFLSQDPEVLGLQRQRQLANLLTGQAFNAPQGQMISGHYVKPSALQQALPMINAAIGGMTNANLDTKTQELAAALRGKEMEAANQYANAKTPQERLVAAMSPNAPQMIKTAFAERLKPQKVGADEAIYSEDFGSGQFTPMIQGPEKQTELMRNYKAAQNNPISPFKGSLLDYEIAGKRAGANNINVNTGQHGFENTMKLGESFKSEPIYKTHQEIRQAYEQVNNSLKREDAAGDLAAAIKINKMLDPTSVVKESEAAHIAGARGILDNLVQLNAKITKGETLSKQQRSQYKSLVKDFYDISGNQYNETRNKYDEFGRANQLVGTETILGVPWKPTEVAKPAGGFNVNPNSLDAELKRRGL